MNDFFHDHINISKINYSGYFIPSACTADHTNRSHHTLSLMLEGEQVYTLPNSTKIHLCKGDVFYVPNGSSYHTDFSEDSKHVTINFDLHNDENLRYQFFSFSILNDPRIISKFHQFAKVMYEKQPGYMNHCFAILYSIIYDLQTKVTSQYLSSSQRKLLERAEEIIEENLASPKLSISFISKTLSVSQEYFRYIFKKKYNMSPKKYIINKRINLSLSLLASSNYTIQEIAEKCGYNDSTHFSTEFKELISCAPSEYRKNLLT